MATTTKSTTKAAPVPAVTINEADRLYTIAAFSEAGDLLGYSCYGFDNAEKKIAALAAWCGVTLPEAPIGTVERYNQLRALQAHTKLEVERRGVPCTAELCQQLIGLERMRVEVVDQYGECRRFWVGRSTGWIPCHIEKARRNSIDGEAVSGAPFKSIRVIGK